MLLDDPDVGYRSSVIYRLRWSGARFIFWGGPTKLVDYHVVSPNQRHAYDVVISKDGATHSGDGTRNDQYCVWGQDVLAPVNGRVGKVMSVLDDQPDQTPGTPLAQSDPGPLVTLHPAGNRVVTLTAGASSSFSRICSGDRCAHM